MTTLDGRVAVVCGASRGIGKGIAVELAAAGARVVAVGRTERSGTATITGSLEETVAEITAAGGSATAVGCDATDEKSVASLFDKIAGSHGHVDVLVNSVFNSHQFVATIGVPFWELPMAAWHEVVEVGTKSAYLASVAAAPLMLRTANASGHGAGTGGLIVNISGRGAERYRYNVVYGVGKAALDRLTRDMADELRPHGVSVVSLWPNVTRTENLDRDPERSRASFGDLEQLETPRYSGRAVVALASDPAVTERSGKRYWVAELGAQYGFTDENGRQHELPE